MLLSVMYRIGRNILIEDNVMERNMTEEIRFVRIDVFTAKSLLLDRQLSDRAFCH